MPSSIRFLNCRLSKATTLWAFLLPLVLATSGCGGLGGLLVEAVVGLPVSVADAVEREGQSRRYREAMCEGKLPPVVPASAIGSLGEYGQFESGSVFVVHDFFVHDFFVQHDLRITNRSTLVAASLMVNTKQNDSVGSYRIRAFVDCDAGTISLVSKTECPGENLSGTCKACVPVDPPLSLLVKVSDTPEAFRESAAYVCEKTNQGTTGARAPR